MSNLAHRTIRCSQSGFRQELLLEVCSEIGQLNYGQHVGLYLPTCEKSWFYGQGEHPKFAKEIRDPDEFPDAETNFDATIVCFPAGFGTDPAHGDPLGVPKLVALMARELIAHRIRTMEEEPVE